MCEVKNLYTIFNGQLGIPNLAPYMTMHIMSFKQNVHHSRSKVSYFANPLHLAIYMVSQLVVI